MATANPLWGAPRIHGELRTLGIDVSERTVSRLLEPHTRPSPQTWKTFLTNHLTSAASMDFFTVPTLTGHVLFVLIVVSHVRRRIVHFNITEHPTAEWTAQQVVDAFPDHTAPKWLHRDRDSVYSEKFRRRVAGVGIAEVVSAPASPWQTKKCFGVESPPDVLAERELLGAGSLLQPTSRALRDPNREDFLHAYDCVIHPMGGQTPRPLGDVLGRVVTLRSQHSERRDVDHRRELTSQPRSWRSQPSRPSRGTLRAQQRLARLPAGRAADRWHDRAIPHLGLHHYYDARRVHDPFRSQ